MKKNIIFLAPPAAGKGTQASLLEDKYNFIHISTGDLLRDEVKSGSELGNKIRKMQTEGILVTDSIVTPLLEKKLIECKNKGGFILDGYPRNIEQVKLLEEILNKLDMKIDYVINLDIDYETAMKRACGRLGCPKCGRIYNTYFDELKPKVDNLCDFCNIELSHRGDDNEKSFKTRFNTFIENTKPLIDYYKEKNMLYNVDSSLKKELVHKQIISVLNEKG